MVDIENTKKIYDYLDENILDIFSKLRLKSDDEKFETLKLEVLNIIDLFRQEKLDKAIKDLKDTQEWDKFTVAFYGETNAGKSTIIESLRLYFRDVEKYTQQQTFRKVLEEHKAIKNSLEFKLEAISNEISKNQEKKKYLSIDFDTKKEQIISEDLKKKENSFFYKILSVLHIISAQGRVDKIKIENDKKTRIIDDILKNQNDEIEKLKTSIEEFEASTLNSLQNLADGQIIGDGRSDFTKKSTVYNFNYNDQEFAFLDVPGIEGHEAIVIDEISSAVKKAHAVFYVTSSSTPPQKGDENKKGTLEKIKEHLGSQTEVYTIFNKRINNPIQLDKPLLNDDEKESLKIVDEKIKWILGENYAGHKSVSAKIAFLALADCLVTGTPNHNEQRKFLEKFSTNELLEKALFDNLCKFITDEMVINTKQKIKKSNYNKASNLLNELIDILYKASKENFEPLYKQIVQEVDDASNNLKNTLRKAKIDLESTIQKALRDFENSTRREIYKYIDENVSNASFKTKLELLLEDNSKKMLEVIPADIEKQMFNFQDSITEVLENFKRRVDVTIQEYQTFNFGDFDSKFNVNLQIDNGIDKMGLAGSLMGAGGTIYWIVVAGNIWNPAGWTMATLGIVVSAVAVLVSFGKSIYKFFSDDYKKSEQRKSADENLENIIKNIEPKIMENIEPIFHNITILIDNIIDDLENVVEQRKIVNEYINKSHQDLVQIAKQIKLEGDK